MSALQTHDDYLDRAAQAVFQALDPAEAAELAAHLANCQGCREAALGYEQAAAALPWALPAATPPAALKARVFERLLAESTAPAASPEPPAATPAAPTPPRLTLVHDAGGDVVPLRPRPASQAWQAAAVALGTGMLASLALNVYFWGHVNALTAHVGLLSQDKAGMEAKLASMQTQSEQRAAQIAVLQARDTRMVKLPGQPMAKDASAMLFWSPAEHAWLVSCAGLPPTATDKTYQLWAVTTAGQKVSLGTFQAGPDGGATLRVNLPEPGMKPHAAAVSLEPAGGMPQPTGPIVMMGELKI